MPSEIRRSYQVLSELSKGSFVRNMERRSLINRCAKMTGLEWSQGDGTERRRGFIVDPCHSDRLCEFDCGVNAAGMCDLISMNIHEVKVKIGHGAHISENAQCKA